MCVYICVHNACMSVCKNWADRSCPVRLYRLQVSSGFGGLGGGVVCYTTTFNSAPKAGSPQGIRVEGFG